MHYVIILKMDNKGQNPLGYDSSQSSSDSGNIGMTNPNVQDGKSIIKPNNTADSENKPNWINFSNIFFIIIGSLQIISIVWSILGILSSYTSVEAQYNILTVLFLGFPFISVVAFINIIGLPIFIIVKKIRGKGLILSILSFLISLISFSFIAYWFFGFTNAINQTKSLTYERQISQAQNRQSSLNIAAEKTKQDAINLMQNCKVDYFVGQSTDEIIAKDQNTKDWLQAAIKSSTGIEILENAPKTYIFASKSLTSELLDNVKKYRQDCYDKKKLYVIIDDYIETEYPMGAWTRVKL